MATSLPAPKISTGIAGLDEVLHGGFLRRGFYMVQGDPGSGKTTFALQFLFSRVSDKRRCLYISLTESKRDLETACAAHGWDLDELDICDLTRSAANMSGVPETSVFHPSETELGETTQIIFDAMDKSNPEFVVFDGLSEMRMLSGSPLIYRRQLLALKEYFLARDVTVVLLDDGSSPFGAMPPESLMGGSIVLESMLPIYGRTRRRLYVTKVRGSDFRGGYHDYDIETGGLVVHPRLVAAEHHVSYDAAVLSSNVPNLDQMLQGGLPCGSTTLLLGPAGTGKSTVAMQFAVSALLSGHKAAAFVFDETLPTFTGRTDRLCLRSQGSIRDFILEKKLHAQQVDPAELTPGAFAHQVKQVVDQGAKVVIIDSMNGYLNAMPEERFLTVHLHELFSYLNQKGVITIMVVAQHGMVIGTRSEFDIDVSYLADTVLLFRYFETRGAIRKAISVFKKRTGAHESSLRQLVVTSEGVQVGKPLKEFRGIMTGVPQLEDRTAADEE